MYKRYLWVLMFIHILFPSVYPYSAREVPKNETTSSEQLDDADVFKEWIALDRNLKAQAGSAIKTVLPIVMDTMGKLNLSVQCQMDSIQLISGLKRLKEWAVKLIDSSGKMIDGALQGKFFTLGDYRECTSIVATRTLNAEEKKQILFKGQYCTIRAKPKLPVKKDLRKFKDGIEKYINFSKSVTDVTKLIYEKADIMDLPEASILIGFCFPSGCTLDDINQIVGTAGEQFLMKAKADRCDIKTDKISYSSSFILSTTVYSLAMFLVLVGSLLQLYSSRCNIQFKSLGLRLLLTFSMTENLKRLFNTKNTNDTFSCLHGIRFLTIAWIVINHTTLIAAATLNVTGNLFDLSRISSRVGMQILMNGFLSVETFFVISGMLNSYLRVDLEEKKKQRSLLYLFVHRLWRIYPVYIFSILFSPLFEPALSGPYVYDAYTRWNNNCEKHWWRTLLFLQNFLVKYNEQCLPQAWYLAVEIQLFIVALFTVELLIFRPKLGITVHAILILASIMFAGIYTKVYNLMPTFIIDGITEKIMSDLCSLFHKPFVHASTYFIGVLAGYFLVKNKDIKIPKEIQVVGWTLSICFACSAVFGTKVWNSGIAPTELESVLYSSLSKTAFALAQAWILICCATGHGGIVNSILSWTVWIPLSRLTFGIFLLSPILQTIYVANLKIGFDLDVLTVVWRMMGDIFFSVLAALAISLLIEAPFMSVEKIILSGDRKESNQVVKSTYTNGAYHVEANDVSKL